MEKKPFSLDVFNHHHLTGETYIPRLVKKYELEDLQKKIQALCNKSKATTGRPVVISHIMQKGGVGKSTSSTCLAQLIANLGFRTLVIDTDPQLNSAKVFNDRIQLFAKSVQEAQANGEEESKIIKHKKNIAPFVDAIYVNQSIFGLGWWSENLATYQSYDVVIIDTPGNRPDDQGFAGVFDINKAGFTGVPHITGALISNLVVLPTGQTGFDLDVFVRYCMAMHFFLKEARQYRYAFCATQVRTLVVVTPNQSNKGSVYSEFVKVREDFSKYVPFFEHQLGFSQKLGNMKGDNIENLFDTKNKILKDLTFILAEMFDAVGESLEFVETAQ